MDYKEMLQLKQLRERIQETNAEFERQRLRFEGTEGQAAFDIAGNALALLEEMLMEMEKDADDLRAIPTPSVSDVTILLSGFKRLMEDKDTVRGFFKGLFQ